MSKTSSNTGAGRTIRHGLNLDELTRDDEIGPMSVTFGEREYLLSDIRDLDFRAMTKARESLTAGNVRPVLETLLAPEDSDAFFANKLSTFKLGKLFEAYNAHYGINPAG